MTWTARSDHHLGLLLPGEGTSGWASASAPAAARGPGSHSGPASASWPLPRMWEPPEQRLALHLHSLSPERSLRGRRGPEGPVGNSCPTPHTASVSVAWNQDTAWALVTCHIRPASPWKEVRTPCPGVVLGDTGDAICPTPAPLPPWLCTPTCEGWR